MIGEKEGLIIRQQSVARVLERAKAGGLLGVVLDRGDFGESLERGEVAGDHGEAGLQGFFFGRAVTGEASEPGGDGFGLGFVSQDVFEGGERAVGTFRGDGPVEPGAGDSLVSGALGLATRDQAVGFVEVAGAGGEVREAEANAAVAAIPTGGGDFVEIAPNRLDGEWVAVEIPELLEGFDALLDGCIRVVERV